MTQDFQHLNNLLTFVYSKVFALNIEDLVNKQHEKVLMVVYVSLMKYSGEIYGFDSFK